jgi:CRISPR-associated endoribonuclease Cas6
MRLNLLLSKPDQIIPFDYHRKLVGVFHKWMGFNDIHDDLSLYSFSRLLDGDSNDKGLEFKTGSRLLFNSYDESILKIMIKGIQNDPNLFYNMKIKEIIIQENPDFTNIENFKISSPIFIKRTIQNQIKFYSFNDEGVDNLMVDTLKTKIRKAGLNNEDFEIKFDREYKSAHTTFVKYNNIKNLVNICPIKIIGSNTIKQFAWNVGIGNSTGIGLGALY